MSYERPSVEDRRDITAQLTQGVKTSGTGVLQSPKWRHSDEEK